MPARQELEKQKACSLGLVVAMLDEVAWPFNLRGRHQLQVRLLWLRDGHHRQPNPLVRPGQVSQVVRA